MSVNDTEKRLKDYEKRLNDVEKRLEAVDKRLEKAAKCPESVEQIIRNIDKNLHYIRKPETLVVYYDTTDYLQSKPTRYEFVDANTDLTDKMAYDNVRVINYQNKAPGPST